MYNADDILAAIWNNPEACTGLHFTRKGDKWQSRQTPNGTETPRSDKTTLKRGTDRKGNPTIWVNDNGNEVFNEGATIWNFLHWLWNTNEHIEVLQRLGDIYGIAPDMTGYTQEQRQRAQQRATQRQLNTAIADYVTNALNGTEGEAARQYLHGRKLEASPRLGAWGSGIKKALAEHLQRMYPAMTSTQIAEQVRKVLPTMRKDYTKDKNGVWVDFTDGYGLIAPYYNGSTNVAGFWGRKTAAEPLTWTDESGEVQEMPKYLFTKDMPKGGYFVNLKRTEPVIMVEGMLDAEAMAQAGYTNVIAFGGQTPTDNEEDAAKSQIQTLQRCGTQKVIYLPDYEFKKDGTLATDATQRTIAALLPYYTGSMDGRGLNSIRIGNLETAEARQQHSKVDAADYVAMFGAQSMHGVLHDAVEWYEYQLKVTAATCTDKVEFAAKCKQIYESIPNPIERQQLKAKIVRAKDGYLAKVKAEGMNGTAMFAIDSDSKHVDTYTALQEAQADMAKAKTPESITKAVAKAQKALHGDAFKEFAAQVNATQEQLHRSVANKPEYLQTTWALWKYNQKLMRHYESRKISFTPAAISIVAAPTNHGKTLVLLQTAIKLAQQTGKKFLYLSIENDAEQLYIRAITAHMGTAWKADEPNPRDEVRQYIKGEDIPKELFDRSGRSINIAEYIKTYWRDVAPHLALVRTPADVDTLCYNVSTIVEEWRNNGIDVGGVFVDYLQLLHANVGRSMPRTEEVKYICDRLNDMAKATALPIVCAVQFNRDATKSDTLDAVELANIGESAGIENIAEDVYLVWQIDKINTDRKEYTTGSGTNQHFALQRYQYRSRRCFADETDATTLRKGYLYVENLKARDYATGGYCLLPFHGAAGAITSDSSEHDEDNKTNNVI